MVNDELEAADPPRNQDPLFSVKDVNTILESDMFLDGLSYYAHRLLAAFGEHRRLVYAILQMYVNYNRPLHFREIRDALPTELSATNVDEIDLVLDGLCEQGVLVRSPTRARYRPRFELVTRLAQRVDLRDF